MHEIIGQPNVRAALFLAILALLHAGAVAQNDPPQSAPNPGVRITFLPPPMEGTLSLGIYDKTGNLVRTLHREAEARKDFTIGLNGLITTWDGKDDAGQSLPAARYSARGYAVGEVEIEGVAMHCNDWITDDDSPRVAKMVSLLPTQASSQSDLGINVILASGVTGTVSVSSEGKIRGFEPREVTREDLPVDRPPDAVHHEVQLGEFRYAIRNGQLVKSTLGASWQELKLPGLIRALFFFPANVQAGGDEFWIIDETPQGREVKLCSERGEFKRRLAGAPGEPQPFALSANPDSTVLRLLEQKAGLQRFRILQLAQPAAVAPAPDQPSNSLWAVIASIEIVDAGTFAAVADKLSRAKPFVPEEKIRIRLLPNELLKGATTEIEVQIAMDAKGAYLKAADGLPLLQITERPNLKWAVMGREGGKIVTIFQSDGAVVEEFKARKLASMMAFDAGEYEWVPAK